MRTITLDDLVYPEDLSPEQVLLSFYTLMRDKKNTFKALGGIFNNQAFSEHHQFAQETVTEASIIMEKMLMKVEAYLKLKKMLK